MITIESSKQRELESWDVSEEEEESPKEEVVEYPQETKILNIVLGYVMKENVNLSSYISSLNPKGLIDQIIEMENFFEFDEMEQEKKVKFVVTKLKGCATLWWNVVQVERRRNNKQEIKGQDRIVAKIRENFFPKGYQVTVFR